MLAVLGEIGLLKASRPPIERSSAKAYFSEPDDAVDGRMSLLVMPATFTFSEPTSFRSASTVVRWSAVYSRMRKRTWGWADKYVSRCGIRRLARVVLFAKG